MFWKILRIFGDRIMFESFINYFLKNFHSKSLQPDSTRATLGPIILAQSLIGQCQLARIYRAPGPNRIRAGRPDLLALQ